MATEKVIYEGINEEYLKDHFITAYFIDNERKNIEVVCNKPDFKSVFTSIVRYEEGDAQWEELKKVTNIDFIHESTYQKKKDERREFEKTVLRIAEKEGLIFEFENKKIDVKFYPKILSAMLEDIDNTDHVFALKLALFENKTISESKDNEGKKKLRQAKDKLSVLQTAISIIQGK
tara:strand:+ start:82 stop:609 length:528 start_codon:yes stop_codon:yes gene_type:complete